MYATMSALCAASYPSFSSARGTVWFTNCIVPPPTSFFVFTSASSGSIPVVSQSIISPIVPVGASTDACALRYPNCSPRETASSHDCFAADSIPSGTNSRIDLLGCRAVLAHDAEHRVAVRVEPVERPHGLGDPRAGAIRLARHERGDGTCPRTSAVGVVRETPRHQQGAEVRVPETQLPIGTSVDADLLGRVIRLSDEDLLRGEHDLHRMPQDATSKLPSSSRNFIRLSDARLHAELSRCMYSEHGFDALIRPDAGHVCHSLIVVSYCIPGSAHAHAASRDLTHEFTGARRLNRLARRHALELPVLVQLIRAHELVGHPHRVVRVLILDRIRVPAVEVHIESGVSQRSRLLFLVRLAPDEVADVGVVDVEDDHLRCATGLAAGLDGPGRGVCASHERDGTRRRPAAGERFPG